MPPASSSQALLARLVVIGALLPAVFVALDIQLLSSWSLFALMTALVVQVGLMGPLCANFIRPRWLMWFIYAWTWVVMDMMVAALAISDPWWGESISPSTVPVAILGGQLGLVITWAAFGQTRWNIRWPAAALLALAILVPTLWHRMPPVERLILVTLQNAMLLFLCIGLAVAGFRLVRMGADTPRLAVGQDSVAALRESQFQLRDVLVWTSVIAVVLAIARAIGSLTTSVAAWEYVRSIVASNRTRDFLMGSPTAAILTAIVQLVALWAALGAGPAWLRILLLAAVSSLHGFIDYVYRMSNAALSVSLWYPQDWLSFIESEDSVLAWHFLTGGMLFAALLMVRSLGYRLCRVTAGSHRQESLFTDGHSCEPRG